MEVLRKDNQKRSDLSQRAQGICRYLNGTLIQVCKELKFDVEAETLMEYASNIGALHSDYISRMVEGATNPALARVLEESAETLWQKAIKKHPERRTDSEPITDEVLGCISIVGNNVYSFHARPDNPAIEKACTIYANEADIAKREEIKEVCNALNRAFNGMAGLFSGYIGIQGGKFYPIENVTNYNPIIYGGY